MTLVNTSGVESEMGLPFAGLHQMLGPLFGGLKGLATPQRTAIEVAFGLREGEPPNHFLIGLAALSLVEAAAEERPLLFIVDDAQWLDRPSTLTLMFVARRLAAVPIGIVFATREWADELRRLPDLEIHGVHASDACALLDAAAPFKLDERVKERLIAETRGNPLTLLELPYRLATAELACGLSVVGGTQVGRRSPDDFVEQLDALPDDARRLLLVAAAEPSGDPLLLWKASERLWIDLTAFEAARSNGLLAIGDRVMFRDPSLRSTVYRSAMAEDRRKVHLALAQETDAHVDPDRRAWHLAAAAEGPDDQAAAELERSVDRAQARGGAPASAVFLQRAVDLTKDPMRRAVRALAAAQASLQAGAFEAANRLVVTAGSGPLDEFARARAELVRAEIAYVSSTDCDAASLLLAAARRLEPFDLELARDTYLTAWAATCLTGRDDAASVIPEICRAVATLPAFSRAPRPSDLLLEGLVLLKTKGPAAASATLRRALQVLSTISPEDVLRWGWMAMSASAQVWDFESMSANTRQEVQIVRDAGTLAALPGALSRFALVAAWTGDFTGACSLIAEIENTAAVTGNSIAPYAMLRLRALQGNEAEVSALLATAREVAAAGPEGMIVDWGHWAAAVLCNGRARYEQAESEAQKALSDPVNGWSVWVLPELVEAACRARNTELARDGLERLAATTRPCGTDLSIGMEARCRAQLSDDPMAEELYREAIQRLGRTPLRPEVARAHLLYGEWLRRKGRRVDAREQLTAAHETFVALGMEAFAERCRRELLALGAKVRIGAAAMSGGLTRQELQIAGLANDGLSNPEIGAQLFLSPRTVEWHLSNVFTKLGIRSRRDLPSALAASEAVTRP
jgi:DNA-binding CsgD family transcriptional regulator